jgi:hypothetical protein
MLDLISITDIAVLGGLLLLLVGGIVIMVKHLRQPKEQIGASFVKHPPQEDEVLARIRIEYMDADYAPYKFPDKALTDKEKLQEKLKKLATQDIPAEEDGYGDEGDESADDESDGSADAFLQTFKNEQE